MKASLFAHAIRGLRRGGIPWLASALGTRLLPPRLEMKSAVLAAVADRAGLEIGGPSRVFSAGRLLPVYRAAARIDNVNFSSETAWETRLRDGGEFLFDPRRPPGRQWIRDATALTGIADASYDFILSSHCLEHVANPLLALQEWRRVVRSGGHLVLILPDPTRSFDHRRPITTLAHLEDDLRRGTGENDPTHFAEILALHDLKRDLGAASAEAFRARMQENATNRCVHHHVFDLPLIAACLAATGWRVLAAERARPVHLITLAQKS